ELQRLLGKKTMENELLKEAVEYGRAKKWIAHAPLLPGVTNGAIVIHTQRLKSDPGGNLLS
ncbi:hypothetical protein UXF57_24510, partial [Escherichia coli]|nr:hypothetical protein [Escherichia coli]